VRKDLVDNNQKRNQKTASLTDSYQPHREMVMRLIEATFKDLTGTDSAELSSVVLLGAGNCLDVELQRLSELFQTIHLVDVDAEAISTASEASGVPGEKLRLHGPADIAEPLLSLTSRDFEPTVDNIEHCTFVLQQLASENGLADIPESDVVVSLCVFSQMLDSLRHVVAEDSPAFTNAVRSLRIGHLRRMLNMLRPGGVAIFVTDIVSSDTAPELKAATDDTIAATVKKLINERNFFSGTNPALVLEDLNMLSRLPGGPDTVHTIDPWLWQMADRTFAVYGLRIQKKPPIQEADEAQV